MRVYWNPEATNFGDTLTPVILRHLGYRVENAARTDTGKVLAVGSVMNALRAGDVVWGSGVQFDQRYPGEGVTFLAVRGPITRSSIDGGHVPQVYGDPALLLPEIFNPEVSRRHKVGVMPHFTDLARARRLYPDALLIDVTGDWRQVIRQVKSCEQVITTSLHGVIACDAYDVLCTWEASYASRILSRNLKFQDHFLATGRPCLQPGPVPPINRVRYATICERLKEAASHLPA